MLWQDTAAVRAPSREAPYQCCEGAGEVLRQRRLPGFLLQQVFYPAGLQLPPHSHERAYVALVMEGSAEESSDGEISESTAGALRYLPAQTPHTNRFLQDTQILRVEVQGHLMERLQEMPWGSDRSGEITGVSAAWLGSRLASEFEARDAVSDMALEGIVLEILAEGARCLKAKNGSGRGPRWLRAAREYLEARFSDDIRLNDVAQIAGVHPVHLAREFRRHYQSSIGEFIREQRIAHASRLLTRSSKPIAEIAIVCGFSDQSHFSSVFKRHMGITPARFREAS